MAGSFADYTENKVLDHVFGAVAYTPPANYTVHLYTTAPTDTGGGTEVAAADYDPITVANNTTTFPAASGGAKSNGIDFEWLEATSNWGTIVAVAIKDGANFVGFADGLSKAIDIGDTPFFGAGDLDITLA